MSAALLVAAAWLPDAAQATPPTPLQTTLTLGTRVVTSSRFAGDNLFLTQTTTSTLSGDLDGTLVFEMRLVLHLPSGTGNYQLTGTFEGAVQGRAGTAELQALGTIEAGTQHCEWTGGRGTGGLAGVHMQGEREGPLGGPLALWGLLHFDP